MGKKGIWLLEKTTEEQLAILGTIAPEYELVKGWGEEKTNFPLEDIEVVYGWNRSVGSELLEIESDSLKWIQVKSAGVDYLDLETMQKKSILLTNGSGIYSIPIAESIMGMLLAHARGLRKAMKDQQVKKWDGAHPLMELHGTTMMIIGAGSIGTETARLAKAFNMETIGVNRSGRAVENMDRVLKQDEATEYLKEADVLVNILPLTDETKYFYDREFFSKVKEGTLFINVGRGPSVDTTALLEALDTGKLSFAGLDVFEQEPLQEDSPLWEREDVMVTPHFSGNTVHSTERLFSIFAENLKAYVAGKELPRNLVDYSKSY